MSVIIKGAMIAVMYIFAVILFPWEWLKEQPHALKRAWYSTFAYAHEFAKGVWSAKAR